MFFQCSIYDATFAHEITLNKHISSVHQEKKQ